MEKQLTTREAITKSEIELLEYIRTEEEGGRIFHYTVDLVLMAMAEFVASEKFSSLDSERRRNLFEQYNDLQDLFDTIISSYKK